MLWDYQENDTMLGDGEGIADFPSDLLDHRLISLDSNLCPTSFHCYFRFYGMSNVVVS